MKKILKKNLPGKFEVRSKKCIFADFVPETVAWADAAEAVINWYPEAGGRLIDKTGRAAPVL